MRRAIATITMLAALWAPSSAYAFGFADFDLTVTDEVGSPSLVAGSHPFAFTTSFSLDTVVEEGEEKVDGAVKDLDLVQPEGLTGNLTAVPRCTTLDFLARNCADATAVGLTSVSFGAGKGGAAGPFSVHNLEPPPGVLGKIGFFVDEVPITVELGLSPSPPYNAVASLRNIPQVLEVFSASTTLWGNPADPVHDAERGDCAGPGPETCPANIPVKPFLTLPRRCNEPLLTVARATAWWTASGGDLFDEAVAETHDDAEPPSPLAPSGCSEPFGAQISAQPTTTRVESPTGLDVAVSVNDEGISNPKGTASSDIRKAVVTLPEGITVNPSFAEGLVACSPAQFAAETLASEAREGCPQAAKVGSLEAESPVLEDKVLRGEVFVATQDDPATAAKGQENPFDSLIALYLVIRDRELGVLVKLAGKVEPDPATGQLITTFGEAPYELPQQPLSEVRFHLRQGGRSPLITPSQCGTYTTTAKFTPWANPSTSHTSTSSVQITQGLGGGPCPPAGAPPFAPGLIAGPLDNNAGSYSPFYLRLTRRDGDQDLTRFDATLPKGITAKLAGLSQCPDSAIAAAKAKSGRAELASPSCLASSEIGNVIGGAGVGSQLTYVPGKIYLGGPVGGAPLSAIGIVPAVAGPFDVGTVVVRQALRVDPRTAEVRIDGAISDPIPHILAGIPLKVRDIRVLADRPNFTLNPTSCDPTETLAQIWGGGAALFSTADDAPVTRSAYFQAANCARLGFKPTLALTLKGGTKRGDHPALHTTYRPRKGDANLKRLVVRLPRSAFLDQAHIRTICTRVQFAADNCPKGAIYGQAKAITPLLSEPLQGPVYLRSSSNDLPDLVIDLHGLVDFEAVGRIDSKNGGIRATFNGIPDAPIASVSVAMQGGRKGLVINSRNLCGAASRADLRLISHNAKQRNPRLKVRAKGCGEG
jgi:hypothetical protein